MKCVSLYCEKEIIWRSIIFCIVKVVLSEVCSDIKVQNAILRFLFVQFINSKADVWKYKMRRLTPNENLSGTQISEFKILWSTLVLFETTCDIF